MVKNIFSLLVLMGNRFHYWIFLFFPRGLKQMEGTCERVSSWQGASIGIRLAPDEARKEPAVQPDVIVEAEFVELEAGIFENRSP